MQWFLGLAEGCWAFDQYADMAKVAIHTAMRNTSLQPLFLYDGGENAFTRWLRDREIPIIECRSSLFDEIAKLRCYEEEVNNRNIRLALRGIFLRIELPQLSERLSFDQRVLYTDCDVFFRDEVVPEIAGNDCKYFAVAGEFRRNDYRNMNTGVMWMNLAALRSVDAEFKAYLRQNLSELRSAAWDQGAFRNFFMTRNGDFLWDKLRPELNWKPYWGNHTRARIIHFHGPKPFQRDEIGSRHPELKRLMRGSFDELCSEWRDLLAEAG